ncbi:hypothetical protein DFH27DRAFT_576023 [Peziza echinospora]|nr:hypothetical protein DFH27DRAFT_576023 [Peziza echinospora]
MRGDVITLDLFQLVLLLATNTLHVFLSLLPLFFFIFLILFFFLQVLSLHRASLLYSTYPCLPRFICQVHISVLGSFVLANRK